MKLLLSIAILQWFKCGPWTVPKCKRKIIQKSKATGSRLAHILNIVSFYFRDPETEDTKVKKVFIREISLARGLQRQLACVQRLYGMDCKGFPRPLIGPDISKQYGGKLSPPEVSGRSSKNMSLELCSKRHIRFSSRVNFQVFIPIKTLASAARVLSPFLPSC